MKRFQEMLHEVRQFRRQPAQLLFSANKIRPLTLCVSFPSERDGGMCGVDSPVSNARPGAPGPAVRAGIPHGYRGVSADRGNLSDWGLVEITMRFHVVLAVLLVTSTGAGLAQASGSCAAPFEFPLKSGGSITVASRSGEVVVVGTDRETVRVSCVLDEPGDAKNVQLTLSGIEGYRKLQVHGGGSIHNFHVRIEVPRICNLKLEVPAGEVRVNDLVGDKDVQLHAGEIVISPVVAADYRSASASVGIGDLSASPFGVQKGGFLHSFSKENSSGHYRLRVHVATGTINLN
jgi:hypothetical protein